MDIPVVLFFVSLFLGYCSSSSEIPDFPEETKESNLTRRITKIALWENQARPNKNGSLPMIVNVTAHLVRVLSVDSKQQSFRISAFLEVSWRDDNLVWNPEDYDGVAKIILSGRNLWIPDIGLLNSLEGDFDFSKGRNLNVMIFSDGKVKWYPGGIYHVGCHLDLTYFPFDIQKCAFHFISWSYGYNELHLNAQKSKMNVVDFMAQAEWDVKNVQVFDTAVYFKPHDNSTKWSLLSVEITCAREPGYYITNVIIPAVIISLLVLTVFLLPCDSGEKVSLGITILVAFTVFQLVIADTLPKNSKSTPLIVIYLTTLMAATATTTLASVTVLNIHYMGSDKKLSPTVRYVIFNVIGRLIRYCRFTHSEPAHTPQTVEAKESITIEKLNSLKRMDIPEAKKDAILNILQDILLETRLLNERKDKNNKEDEVINEWREAARIVDRFLMLIYFMAILVITLIFIVVLPSFQPLP